MSVLTEASWPADRLGEALQVLASHSGLIGPARPVAAPPAHAIADQRGLSHWLQSAAERIGVEALPVEAPYHQVDELLLQAGPALLFLPRDAGATSAPHCLLLLRGQGRRVLLLTPNRTPMAVSLDEVRAVLCRDVEARVSGQVERVLNTLGLAPGRQRQTRQALLRQLLACDAVGGCWQLRVAGNAHLAAQVRESRLGRLLGSLIGAHLCEYALWIASWWILGSMTLRGQFDPGWLMAWFLLLLCLIPFRLLTTCSGGLLSVRAGTLLKRRLLAGAMRLDPDEVRHLGAGQLLGRVMEAEVVELTAVTGGFLAITAVIELTLAGILFAAVEHNAWHVALWAAAIVSAAVVGVCYHRRLRRWVRLRLDITNDLVERMVGHRTRLVQQSRAHWNEGEDQRLEGYLEASQKIDFLAALLHVVLPRVWLMAAALALIPAFVFGARTTAQLAVGVGGILLAQKALRYLAEGLERLTAALVACERIALFWHAAARAAAPGDPQMVASAWTRGPADRPVLEAHDLVFNYGEQKISVLRHVDAAVYPGDRVLLEGGSGSGKSTLAALLAGCRDPSAGLLLLQGLDRQTLGTAEWRRRVVLSPQFHENHVLMGTFAFNVLMGRAWPPKPADLDEAERLCRALDLGPLLDRMPGGLLQLVGETGWQLSQGEKSRLYIARALLQNPDVVLLDESFAALDPPTLRRTLNVVLEKSPTLLVIAHP